MVCHALASVMLLTSRNGCGPATSSAGCSPMANVEQIIFEEWAQTELAPDLDLIAPAVDRLCRVLRERNAPRDGIEDIRYAVTEALANAVKHGHAVPHKRDVRMRWAWKDEWLEIQVSEPGSFTPPPGWTELPEDPLVESGRGGFLMTHHTDELDHANALGRHTLRLRKRLGVAPLASTSTVELEQTLGAMTEDLSACYETLAALFRLAEALATMADLPAFAAAALKLRPLIEADTMHVRFVEPPGQLVLLGAWAEGCEFPCALDSRGPCVEAEVFRSGLERTTDGDTAFAADDPLRLLGAAFVCPVYFQSRQLGVCVLGRRSSGARFTAAQLSLARSIAEFLGIAHTNAELQSQRAAQLRTQRELEIAAQIQQSLLPTEFPLRRDWSVHGRCANALEAGGDFFDVVEVSGGVVLVIADVMGKGISAALIAVVLRTAVRAHIALAQTPGALLSRVSVQIAADLARLGIFITAQAVFLEADSPRISYASAGHCAMIALASGGAASRVMEEGGLPLGVSQAENYTTHEEFLEPSERLILLTDGFLEAPDELGQELGVEGFVAAARDLHARDPKEACAELLRFVYRRDAGRLQTDDRTVVVAQRLA